MVANISPLIHWNSICDHQINDYIHQNDVQYTYSYKIKATTKKEKREKEKNNIEKRRNKNKMKMKKERNCESIIIRGVTIFLGFVFH